MQTQERPDVEVLKQIRDDPVLFSQRFLGHDPWAVPQRIMRALVPPRARVAVKSCHASSKTFTAADLVIWWVARGGRAITTGPTGTQVGEVLWPEIHKAMKSARYPLGIEELDEELRTPRGGQAIGFSTDKQTRMRGFHGQMLLIFDEGPGIRQDLWTAAEGISAAGDVRWLVLGNPLPGGGPYQALFSDPSFQHITIDAFDTPNLEGLTLPELLELPEHELDNNVRPYLITRRWVRERYEAWGEDSEEWQALVRGQFANNPQTALIWTQWINAATDRIFAVPDLSWRLQAGLDVAGPGEDETVLRLRLGPKVLRQWTWKEGDTLRLLGAIRAALNPYRDQLFSVVVDAAGIGWHLGGSLVADYGRRVVLLNVSESSRFPKLYARLKDELYWGLRERFQSGDIGGQLDDVTIAQLGEIRYHHTVRGLIEIESKDDARARGVKSPDRAEALMLCFAPIAETRRPTAITMTA